jgi:hypothetical protein
MTIEQIADIIEDYLKNNIEWTWADSKNQRALIEGLAKKIIDDSSR